MLTLTASAAGVVLEPQEAPAPPHDDQVLPTWSGIPLDRKNMSCHLERGTLLCLVGDPLKHEAVLFVDETDVQYVREGQHVRLQFSVAPTTVFTGRVTDIAKRDIQLVPRELTANQDLASITDSRGARRPLRTSYSVRVALDEHQEELLTGARGRARISVDPQPLSQRALRTIRRTLTIEL
jgi:putative peptide zinc metalloprotease protein